MSNPKVEIGSKLEVEGLPQSPDVNEYYDENSGECNITFAKCDCLQKYVSAGCAMCERAHEKYIAKMVKTETIKPTTKVEAEKPYGNHKTYTFYRNKLNSVFLHTDDDLECAKGSWWYKYLKEIPASIWNVAVEKFEYPAAFALWEAIGKKRPIRVFMNTNLPMIWEYPNMYYIIAPCGQLTPEEIKEFYLKKDAEAQARARAEEDLKIAQEVRQAGTKKAEDPDQPKERPATPTRDKRQVYGSRRNRDKPTSRQSDTKVYNSRPAPFEEVRDEPKKVYHTTRGTRVRK